MFTRSAIFEGKIRVGSEDIFLKIVQDELVPVWRRMPNALAVRLYRRVRSDQKAPALTLVQEIDYPSLEAVAEAEASPIREEGAPIMDRLMTMFEGRLVHTVYERLL
ncbi:hypothetical protein HKX42_00765 [Salinisphaera sp. USBA-960]|uniref:hypothetical protein n=1 Tax=Salinisphaera orenii TaxID=856731 RepID=UPI000DBE487F|nr:hypothetical protein [Salifodinibacter halophilus]NNC25416.1 hypothetical protein [Salifodinibacter halophilus]